MLNIMHTVHTLTANRISNSYTTSSFLGLVFTVSWVQWSLYQCRSLVMVGHWIICEVGSVESEWPGGLVVGLIVRWSIWSLDQVWSGSVSMTSDTSRCGSVVGCDSPLLRLWDLWEWSRAVVRIAIPFCVQGFLIWIGVKLSMLSVAYWSSHQKLNLGETTPR